MANVGTGTTAQAGGAVSDYDRGMRAGFRKIEIDWQISMNPLERYFKKEGNMMYKTHIDYVKKVTSDPIDNPYQLPQPTGDAKVPSYFRRTNEIRSQKIHIANPRGVAKVLSESVESLVERDLKLARNAFAEAQLKMMLDLLTATYYENPLTRQRDGTLERVNPAAPTAVPFKKEFQHLFKGKDGKKETPATATNVFQAFPNVDGFFFLTGSLAEYKQTSMLDGDLSAGSGTKNPKNRCLIIMTNTGYAIWKKSNVPKIGNRDYFGKDVMLGVGKITSFQDYDLLVIPDEYLPKYNVAAYDTTAKIDADFANALTFPDPARWNEIDTDLLTAVQGAANRNVVGGYAYPHQLHQAIVVDQAAMRFMNPTQLQVKLHQYVDTTTSMEKYIYGETSMEATRIWDGLVRRFFFTGEAFSGLYK